MASESQFAAYLGASHPAFIADEFPVKISESSYSPDNAAGGRVRLSGLRGAVHLTGRECVIRGAHPANPMRGIVRLADRSEVSVKRENCLII